MADGAAKGAELLAAATPAYRPAPPTSTNDTSAAFAGRELPRHTCTIALHSPDRSRSGRRQK